jgi:transcriptional regulator
MPQGRILSDEQLETMAELRERGWTYERIARHFARSGTVVSYKTIRWQCLRLGAFKPGNPPANIGVKASGRGRAFTPEEDAQIRSLDAQGLSNAEIGRRLDRRSNSIIGRKLTLAMHDAFLEDAA